ncbi:MAG: DUF1761 domain-containing protein [Candidatus Kaiserbacteria bacterium]|nr:MAG: DUF1761 domain-containing protein [Candidatus Kaiserbacteria bacterium]
MTEVSLISLLASGIVSLLIGFAWYHPKVFGGIWMRLSNITPESQERGKRRMPVSAGITFLASMVIAYVMSYFGIAWGVYDPIGAIELAFWIWIGFVAPTMLGTVLWEQKPFLLYVINVGFWFVALVAIAIVLVF